MEVGVKGSVDPQKGMAINFSDIKKAVNNIIDQWDHATFVYYKDKKLLNFLRSIGSKRIVLPFESTTENLVRLMLSKLRQTMGEKLRALGITDIQVRIAETSTTYAESSVSIEDPTPKNQTQRRSPRPPFGLNKREKPRV